MTKKKRNPVNETIKRNVILAVIKAYLDNMKSNTKDMKRLHSFHSAAEYAAKAEALIGLLEVDDCGSFGGHDKERGQKSHFPSLIERYEWLRSIS